MFAKLKKKIAEDAAIAPRSGIHIPRTISKESIASVGADSGDDASEGSSSKDDLSNQLLRRNDQIRKLEAKLSDYAEQLRIMQKTKDKLELTLEKHQDLSIKKLQEQNECHQICKTRMAEAMALALEKKDQEWIEKMTVVEKEKAALSAQMMEKSLPFFQKKDGLDELEGFQHQEVLLKKEQQLSQWELQLWQTEVELQSTKRDLADAQGKLQVLRQHHEQSRRLHSELETEREKLLLLREESDKKIKDLEGQCQELRLVISQVSEDFQKSQNMVSDLEGSLRLLQAERDALRVQQQKKASLEQNLEMSRAELLALRTNHADTVSALKAQVEELTTSLQRSQQEVSTATEMLALREENITALHNEAQHWQASLFQLQKAMEYQQTQQEHTELNKDSQLASLRAELLSQTQQLNSYQARISFLEVEVETLTEQPQSPEMCDETHNGSVMVDDLDHIQKVNRDLEQQLSDKNKTIKQLQQRLAELKRTLQRELKLKPEADSECKEKCSESQVDKEESGCPEPPPISSPPISKISSPPISNTMVTNTLDLNISQDINFEYLKHVVLKFMSSREAEAFQLIRAVSVLLNFTREEEDMLKQTLEYKMSWFGSKPSPKGILRPSVSGTLTPWR